MFRFLVGASAVILACAAALPAVAHGPRYHITGAIAAPDFRWDYLAVDPNTHRLYVATHDGVTALDLATGRLMPILVPGKHDHGVIPVGNTGTAVATSGAQNLLIWFHGDTGAVIAKFPTGKEPDTVLYEPVTKKYIVWNQDSNDASVIDLKTRSIVGTIALPGSPEFGVADGTGLVYDNIADKNEIAVADVAAGKVVREIPLKGCKRPTGLAYDAQTGLLISVCGSGVAKIIEAKTGHEVASLPVGKAADAVILDAKRRLAFIPSGGSGTLTVIALKGPNAVKIVQVLKTKRGVRTGTVDPISGELYLPSADFRPVKENSWPDVVPGTVKYLVVSP